MNKKGFTLIELLAVILVLGIIALIAIPVVNKVIDQAKKGAFERTVENIVKAVEEECQKDMLLGNTTAKTYTFTDGVATPTINVKGKLPKSGTISVNNACESTVNVTDGKYSATKSSTSEEIIVGKTDEAGNETGKNITLTTDNNSNGEADIGDIITVKSLENTNEEFYVISNEGENITALAKYNLKVGNTYNSSGYKQKEYDSSEEHYNLQDSEMRGYFFDDTTNNGTTAFSSEEQHGTNYSSYEESVVEGYVDAYKNKLPNEVISARLITKEEIEELVNDGEELSWGSINEQADDKNRAWIYSTSYWTGSARYIDLVWCFYRDGGFYGDNYYYTDNRFGVRPVITISKSEI